MALRGVEQPCPKNCPLFHGVNDSVDSLPAKGALWFPLCPPYRASQAELVETGGHISNIIFSVAAGGAAPLCLCGHVCLLQHAGES